MTRSGSPVGRQGRPDTHSRVETMDYLAMLERMLRAAGRRVADADEPELGALIALERSLRDAIQVGIDGQRSRGRSWAHIADATGTTRQAAWERWGRPS